VVKAITEQTFSKFRRSRRLVLAMQLVLQIVLQTRLKLTVMAMLSLEAEEDGMEEQARSIRRRLVVPAISEVLT